jgi:hypothetical protein
VNIAGFEIGSDSTVFLAVLAVHVPIGLVAVLTGLGAMLRDKRRGAHTILGTIYFWSLATLFATSTGLAVMRWSNDYHLFVLGALAFATAVMGRTARRQRWRTQIDMHVVGMGASYILMLTAFYVDNGKNLPIWRDLPYAAYWFLPSAVGIPLIVWALGRERRILIHAAAHRP